MPRASIRRETIISPGTLFHLRSTPPYSLLLLHSTEMYNCAFTFLTQEFCSSFAYCTSVLTCSQSPFFYLHYTPLPRNVSVELWHILMFHCTSWAIKYHCTLRYIPLFCTTAHTALHPVVQCTVPTLSLPC